MFIWGRSWPWSIIVGIISTYAQSVPITTDVVSSNLDQREVYNINKTDRHNITEILLKVALNAIKQTNK